MVLLVAMIPILFFGSVAPSRDDSVLRTAGVRSPATGEVVPEHVLALLDSLQTESIFKWFTREWKEVTELDSLQFELGTEFFRETGDSMFLELALAGRKRVHTFNLASQVRARGRLGLGEQIDSLIDTRNTFQQLGVKRQELLTNILIGELNLLLKKPDYPEVFTYLFSALTTAREIDYPIGEAHALVALARLYNQLSRIETAKSYFSEALTIAESIQDDLALHRAFEGLTRLEILAGDPAEGLRMYEEITESSDHVIKHFGDFHYYYKGIARWKLGDNERALRDLQLASTWVEKMKLAMASLRVTLATGRVFEDAGRMVEARRCYEGVLNQESPELTRPFVWEAAFRLGVISEEKGDLEAAVGWYADAIHRLEDYREELGLATLSLYFLEDKLSPYERLIDLLYRMNREGETEEMIEDIALEYSERSRMRGFLSTIRQISSSREAAVDPSLLESRDEILHDINVLRMRSVSEGRTSWDRERYLKELEVMKIKLNEVKLSIELADQKHIHEDSYANLTLVDEVREKILDSRTCIIEYSIGKKTSFAWIVKQNDIRMEQLPGLTSVYPPAALYVELLSQGEESYMSVGERLFADLIQPFINDLDGMESVIIVPDGVLHHLPFESLPVAGSFRDGQEKRYLVDEYDISYTPSISTLLLLLERQVSGPPAGSGIIALGDPTTADRGGFVEWVTALFDNEEEQEYAPSLLDLQAEMYPRIKSSGDEVDRIVSFFPPAGRRVMLGKEANEGAFKNEPLHQYEVIHFATHGVYDDNSPELSGLVLSDSPGEEDGFLLVDEISDLELNAPMVVLSGCKTGLGRYISGEGVVGLSRAFLTAGASATVVSLWEIGDESTTDFMEEFYRGYTRGLGKAHSLGRAKRKMIDQGRHPSVWAPFVIIGDYR